MYARMKLQEQLAFLASIRGLSLAESTRRAAAWLDRIGLAARAQSLTHELSKGNQQKVQFAAARFSTRNTNRCACATLRVKPAILS